MRYLSDTYRLDPHFRFHRKIKKLTLNGTDSTWMLKNRTGGVVLWYSCCMCRRTIAFAPDSNFQRLGNIPMGVVPFVSIHPIDRVLSRESSGCHRKWCKCGPNYPRACQSRLASWCIPTNTATCHIQNSLVPGVLYELGSESLPTHGAAPFRNIIIQCNPRVHRWWSWRRCVGSICELGCFSIQIFDKISRRWNLFCLVGCFSQTFTIVHWHDKMWMSVSTV